MMEQAAHQHRPDETSRRDRLSRRVLLVGWQGTDSRTIQSLLQAGRLTHLQALLDRSAHFELAVPRPANLPSAWTTLATGRRPHEHGILHTVAPTSSGIGLEPISSRHRRRAAFWNLLNDAGLQTLVIGWPVTYPAEAVAGVCVSDRIAAAAIEREPTDSGNAWASPQQLLPILRSRFVAPGQLDEITVAQMLPRPAKSSPVYPQLEAACRSIVAEAATYFRMMRWCLSERPWDFAACVFPGLRRAHELADWLERIAPGSSEYAHEIVTGCYEHHDLLLGQLLQQPGETHVIAIALGAGRPNGESTGGLAAIAGPAVRPASLSSHHSALDLAPTLLAMLGAPIPADLPGYPWRGEFERDLPIHAAGTNGVQPTEPQGGDLQSSSPLNFESSPNALDPSVEHLVQLGYIDPREIAEQERLRSCKWTVRFQQAISELDAGMLDHAIAKLELLVDEQSESHSARAMLAEALFRAGRRSDARRQVEWLRYHGNEQPQVYRLAAAIEFASRDFDAALAELQGTRRGTTRCSGADVMEGSVWLRKRDLERARTAYQSAIEQEGPSRDALTGMAGVELMSGQTEAAAMHALDALSSDMSCGRAHYYLAVALTELDRPQEALQALENWAMANPTAAAPYRWMARVCDRQLHCPERAADCRARGRQVVRSRRSTNSRSMGDTSAPWY